MEADPASAADTRELMGRVAGLYFLFGAATTVGAILLPHSRWADVPGFWAMAAGTAIGGALLLRLRRVLPAFSYGPVMVLATLVVSLSLYLNGERHGGPPANNEVLYLWVALYSAYFFTGRQLLVQLAIVAGAYAGALLAIHPGQIGFTRWLITVGMVSVAAVVVHVLKARNDQLMGRLFDAARTDRLTGLSNRQGFDERLDLELARGRRTARPIALILADIDCFKDLNDLLGHQAGDSALREVGQVARSVARNIDTMARIGGDEFAAILPDTDAHGARDLAERLRGEVAALAADPRAQLTMSVGVVEFPTHGQTAGSLISAADRALYEAKRGGRDQSVVQRLRAGEDVAGWALSASAAERAS